MGKSWSNIEAEDTYWMRQALRNAHEGSAAAGGSPIGCVIVRDGAIIGHATDGRPGRVVMHTVFGGRRIVDMLVGEQLPRIC